jgi:hypothetical protein
MCAHPQGTFHRWRTYERPTSMPERQSRLSAAVLFGCAGQRVVRIRRLEVQPKPAWAAFSTVNLPSVFHAVKVRRHHCAQAPEMLTS